jgi:glutathione S-transferase
MKLYTDEEGTAPSPRRVRMYLAEKAIVVPFEELELHRANRTPEFREKNPIGTLPVLELDDGSCISESIAICRYFEELRPHPALFGSTPQERADVEMWTRRVEHYLYLPIDLAGYLGRAPGSRQAKQELEASALRTLRLLDRTLAEAPYIAGGRISMADIFAFGALDYGLRFAGFRLPEGLAHLHAWFEAMAARPSAKA